MAVFDLEAARKIVAEEETEPVRFARILCQVGTGEDKTDVKILINLGVLCYDNRRRERVQHERQDLYAG